MAVDQLQQTSPARPATPAGTAPPPNDTGSTAQGRNRTMLFAAILGGVIVLGALGFWLYSRNATNLLTMLRWMAIWMA